MERRRIPYRSGATRVEGGAPSAAALSAPPWRARLDWSFWFAEILVLWLRIAATVAAFWRVRPLAGALLVPYVLWVTFAGALTYSIWQRNPGLLV